jgi:hypothetical protein
VRGREHWPTPQRVETDRDIIEMLKRGDIESVISRFPEYARNSVVEMGGRAIATMLGATRAVAADAGQLSALQFGDYAQSSGSGNANLVISDKATLAALA